jgi:transcriptional regulator with XRE-family HTH domain
VYVQAFFGVHESMENSFSIQDFGDRVRALRKAQGYSQEGFSDEVGLDRTYIGGIERGERNPALKAILKIATALNVPPEALFQKET